MRTSFLTVIAVTIPLVAGCVNKVPADITDEDVDADEGTEDFEGDEPGECTDDADNDRDGLFDCDDPDCEASEACSGDDEDSDADGGPQDTGGPDDTSIPVDDTGDNDTGISLDVDGDGVSAEDGDCDDGRSDVYPGAIEVCDGVDNNCDDVVDEPGAVGSVTYYSDSDGDGYGDDAAMVASCTMPDGYAASGGDCDDARAESYPGAPEICDGFDNDCDDVIDEEGATGIGTYYLDEDGDGYGVAGSTIETCTPPDGYAVAAGDCDDGDASRSPGTPEACDGVDNDCDGDIDEAGASGGSTYYADADGDGYGSDSASVEACSMPTGHVTMAGDCDDGRSDVHDGAEEVCDGFDNDCDGDIYEAGASGIGTYYRDSDGDGYGLTADTVTSCSPPAGYATSPGDCDDGDASRSPGAVESCDGIDNDCDSDVDEGVTATYYRDTDGDSYGVWDDTTEGCSLPAGYADAAGDCSPGDASVHPGAVEVCDGVDNNCAAGIDESGAVGEVTRYEDFDYDGHGAIPPAGCGWSTFGDCPTRTDCPDEFPSTGYATVSDDCDDADSSVYSGAPEICDGKDNDCDGTIDEGASAGTFYRDVDGDGYGVSTDTVTGCSAPSGYVALSGDCNDGASGIHPGAAEVCDEVDNDCDGSIDEGVSMGTYYRDSDGDGYGVSSDSVTACSAPSGYVASSGDCNDGASGIYPGAAEICDDADNDCDGAVDEGVAASTYYIDSDGDGQGDPSIAVSSCSAPAGYVTNSTDCCDSDGSAYLGSTTWGTTPTSCGGYDYNCDGSVTQQHTTTGATCLIDYESFSCELLPGPGWMTASAPACGESGTLLRRCASEPEYLGTPFGGYICFDETTLVDTVAQGCR